MEENIKDCPFQHQIRTLEKLVLIGNGTKSLVSLVAGMDKSLTDLHQSVSELSEDVKRLLHAEAEAQGRAQARKHHNLSFIQWTLIFVSILSLIVSIWLDLN